MTDAALPPLIQQMQTSEFYAHPVQQPIQLIQTHISYILLTGEYAYKVKKPLNFGFLDYSTLDKRHHFCQEELRLNQRAAAELYLQVLPVAQVGDRFQFTDQVSEAVEFVVQMRQFPQETLLTALFDRGDLTADGIAELARAIAKFHKTAARSAYIDTFGQVDQIRQAFDENYAQTEKYIGGPQTLEQFQETQAYSDRFFAEQADLFQERVTQGWIRECHGDLHLGNICYWRDRFWLFDCIEFNEPFRFVDVMFDIAYIVMDLNARQRPDLRTRFLNTYCEQMGDWEGLRILPLYVNRQSYVRAKVTSFLLDDPAIDSSQKAAIQDTAALYYKLAWDCTQPKPSGKIILMAGLSGSGKSTLARQLAEQTGAIAIRSDAVRKHLGGIALEERGDDRLYTPEMTQKTYDRLRELGMHLARTEGYTVILDAKYDRVALRQPVLEAARAANLAVEIYHCTAPLEVLRDRLQQRTGDIADATVDVLAGQSFEPFTAAELPQVRVVDTTQPFPAV
jgi:aminoglycoside phosphotransferase family enzyme/predicted kinase